MLEELGQIDTSAIEELAGLRRAEETFRERLARMSERREAVSEEVFARVEEDYRTRLEGVLEQARPLEASARDEYATLRTLHADLTERLEEARLAREEIDFRRELGEFEEESEFESKRKEVDALITDRRADLEEAEALRQRFLAVFESEEDLEQRPTPRAATRVEEIVGDEPADAIPESPTEADEIDGSDHDEVVEEADDEAPGTVEATTGDESPDDDEPISEGEDPLTPGDETDEAGPTEADDEPSSEATEPTPSPPPPPSGEQEEFDTLPPPPRSTRALPEPPPAPRLTDVRTAPVPTAPPDGRRGWEATRVDVEIPDGPGVPPLPEGDHEATIVTGRSAPPPPPGESETGATVILTRPRVVHMVGGEAHQEFILGPRPTSIGRAAENDIHLPEEAVSRRHAQIALTTEGFVLEDLDSENGTLVNGEAIRERQLVDRDEIRVGTQLLVFRSA